MIWIATIGLLAVFTWLLFNALNERRWVKAHQDNDNENVDHGFIEKYSQLNNSAMPEDRYSINKQDNPIGRFATNLKERTSGLGDKIERKATEKFKSSADEVSAGASGITAGGRSWSEVGKSIVGDDSMIGRATERVSKKAVELGERLPTEKLKPAKRDKGAPSAGPNGPVGRFVKNVSSRIEEIDQKV